MAECDDYPRKNSKYPSNDPWSRDDTKMGMLCISMFTAVNIIKFAFLIELISTR